MFKMFICLLNYMLFARRGGAAFRSVGCCLSSWGGLFGAVGRYAPRADGTPGYPGGMRGYSPFISSMKLLAGLKLGRSWAAMVSVVFFRMLRAVLAARCLMMKLPKPRRYTFSFLSSRLDLTLPMKHSTTVATSFLGMPV